MAATNRPDVLDPALLRPGPLRPPHHRRSAQPQGPRWRSSRSTAARCRWPTTSTWSGWRRAPSGLTGADIRNLVNEAALWASRHDKDSVDMADFEYARDKVLMGSKREEVLTGKEKSMTAYHEAGHALLAWLVPGSDRVHKVSIIPRGRALGVTQLLPEEDRAEHQRERAARAAGVHAGRPGGREARLRRVQRRRRGRPEARPRSSPGAWSPTGA